MSPSRFTFTPPLNTMLSAWVLAALGAFSWADWIVRSRFSSPIGPQPQRHTPPQEREPPSSRLWM